MTRRCSLLRSSGLVAAGASPVRVRTLAADWVIDPPSGDPFVRQELVETVYHIVWELSHMFFEHRGLLAGRTARPGTTPARRASSTRS